MRGYENRVPAGVLLDANWAGATASGSRVYPLEAYRADIAALFPDDEWLDLVTREAPRLVPAYFTITLEAGFTKYTPPAGIPELRAAVIEASWLSTPKKVDRPKACAMMIVEAPSPQPTSATVAPERSFSTTPSLPGVMETPALRADARAVQETVERAGFSVVTDFAGHGIGRRRTGRPCTPQPGPPHVDVDVTDVRSLAVRDRVVEARGRAPDLVRRRRAEDERTVQLTLTERGRGLRGEAAAIQARDLSGRVETRPRTSDSPRSNAAAAGPCLPSASQHTARS